MLQLQLQLRIRILLSCAGLGDGSSARPQQFRYGSSNGEVRRSTFGGERVYLPIDPGVVLLDIAFVPDDPNHGFLLGTRQTILETKDGGNTWAPRSIPSAEDANFNYRFNSISFKGNEGWIVGKPAILLHTSNAGESWERIPLSSQLPVDMVYIKATGVQRSYGD